MEMLRVLSLVCRMCLGSRIMVIVPYQLHPDLDLDYISPVTCDQGRTTAIKKGTSTGSQFQGHRRGTENTG